MKRAASAATIVAVVALAVAVVRLPHAIRTAHAATTAPHQSLLQRDLQPDWWPQPYIYRLAVGARQLIPKDATYTVVMHVDSSTADLVRDGLPLLLRYALMPRRYTGDIHQAQYVITWDQPSGTLGVPVKHTHVVTADGNVVEVAR